MLLITLLAGGYSVLHKLAARCAVHDENDDEDQRAFIVGEGRALPDKRREFD